MRDQCKQDNLLFTNVLDKGYQVSLLAYREGKQTMSQPTFAKSDAKFTGAATIFSTSVAHDRSGNEQGVNFSKILVIIQHGLNAKACPIQMCNVWLGWAFRTNFMFELVL